MKDYLAFDIDGTIFDAGNIVVEAFELGVKNYIKYTDNENIDIPKQSEIVKLLGLTMDNIFISLYPKLTKSERVCLIDYCTDAFVLLIKQKKGEIFDDVVEVVSALKKEGFYLVTASNGKREYVKAVLETYDLIDKFENIMFFPEETLESGLFLENKTDVVRAYLDNLVDDGNLIMIGDRYTDREAAENNNISFVGCAFGHVGSKEIEDCKWIINSFNEIPSVVDKILNN